MHLGMVECHVPYSSHFDIDLDLVLSILVSGASTSLTFIKVGIPNFVYKCILDGNLVCECILK